MSKKSKRRPAPRPRKKLNLGGPREITFYIVRFMAKVPDELREGTDAPEWIKRESPPTLDEEQAHQAYQAVIDELMSQHSGIRAPQLLVRTVTEDVLRDYDAERAATMADAMAEELDAKQAETDAAPLNDVDAVIERLAAESTP